MKIDFSKEQYEDLLKMCEVADSVYGIMGDMVSEDYKKQSERIVETRRHLLSYADQFGCGEMAEVFEGEIIPSDKFSEEMQAVIDDYGNETFWHELETRLGKRDFEKDMTDEEKKEVEKEGWLPLRVNNFYDKWAKELEEHGVERLGVIKDN